MVEARILKDMTEIERRRRYIRVGNWEQVYHLAEELKGFHENWRFRGQRDDEWPLEPTLERAARILKRGPGDLLDPERRTVGTFKSLALPAGCGLPRDAGSLEWVALLRHYGGPARLLDFTRSFWVGAFFALQADGRHERDGAKPVIWAVESRSVWHWAKEQLERNTDLWKQVEAAMTKDGKRFCEEHYSERMRASRFMCSQSIWGGADDEKPCEWQVAVAIPVEAEFVETRMGAQQACFMAPLDLTKRFGECLFGMMCDVAEEHEREDYEPGSLKTTKPALINIMLPDDRRGGLAIMERMNITASALFPGLGGFAGDQYTHLIR